MNARAANAYKKVDLESAPKDQILERLLERCVADLAAGRQAITDGRIQVKAQVLDHALRIVLELEAALDHAQAPEMCANLSRLYRFASERITTASMTLTTAPLDDAIRVVRSISDAFREARGR